jgi:hypothetical protein
VTTEGINRRKFRRLALMEDALVVDDTGRKLGCVSQASGGGMLIQTASQAETDTLNIGQELHVTVIEPGSQTQNMIDVVIRYKEKNMVGVEFVTGKKKSNG